MSDYEPGTVALCVADAPDQNIKGEVFVSLDGAQEGPWYPAGSDVPLDASDLINVRPLRVCADDEVAVKADDLKALLLAGINSVNARVGRAVHAALTSYDAARTPAIEEPTGLGAVVRDRSDRLWVRDKTTTTAKHWKKAEGCDGSKRYFWSEVHAAEVLSPGVEVDRG